METLKKSFYKNGRSEPLLAAPFFNSLLREWQDWRFLDNTIIEISLAKPARLLVELKMKSHLGRHIYTGKYWLVTGEEKLSIDYFQAARKVVESICQIRRLPMSAATTFLERLENNAENLRMSHDVWPDQASFESALYDFMQTEQALIFGHSFHPTPKSKGSISTADQQSYCPEFRAPIKLIWYQVSARLLREGRAASADCGDPCQRLAEWDDPAILEKLKKGYKLIPLHPLQEERILAEVSFAAAIESGDCYRIESSGRPWYATSSVRTLYSQGAPFQLKFSLGIKLTNSMRYLSVSEVERGLQFYDAFHHPYLKGFTKKNTRFTIVHEPCYLGITDGHGRVFKDSIVSFRENPWNDSAQQLGTVATLTQVFNENGNNLLRICAKDFAKKTGQAEAAAFKKFFHGLLDCYLFPLIELAVDYGVYGSAHAQNLVVEFKDGFPQKCYFRDCQGTWYNPKTHERLLADIPALADPNCLVISKEKSAVLFTYYCVINATFNIVTALAAMGEVSEEELLEGLYSRLNVYAYRNPHPLFHYLLRQPNWQYKGNFMCTLDNLDEVSQADPLAIYTKMVNPLRRRPLVPRLLDIHPPAHPAGFQVIARDTFYEVFSEGQSCICLLSIVEGDVGHIDLISRMESSDDMLLAVMVGLEVVFGKYRTLQKVIFQDRLRRLIGSLEGVPKDFVNGVSRQDLERTPDLFIYAKKACAESSNYRGDQQELPDRPALPNTILYRRYQPLTGLTITIESFDLKKHLKIFHEWHHQRRVAEFWELDKSIADLGLYIEKLKKEPHIHPVILSYNDEPAGYFELYWCLEDRLAPFYDAKPFDRGMHLLIGNKKYLGFENTYTAWAALQHFLFLDDPRTDSIMLEPRHDNDKILKYVAALDNVTVEKDFDFPHKRAKLVRCQKNGFFKGAYL